MTAKLKEQTATATHTPGPWQIARIHPDPETNKNLIQIFPKGELEGLEIATIYCAPDGSVKHANAKLIAAAPALLNACKILQGVHAWAAKSAKGKTREAILGCCDWSVIYAALTLASAK